MRSSLGLYFHFFFHIWHPWDMFTFWLQLTMSHFLWLLFLILFCLVLEMNEWENLSNVLIQFIIFVLLLVKTNNNNNNLVIQLPCDEINVRWTSITCLRGFERNCKYSIVYSISGDLTVNKVKIFQPKILE